MNQSILHAFLEALKAQQDRLLLLSRPELETALSDIYGKTCSNYDETLYRNIKALLDFQVKEAKIELSTLMEVITEKVTTEKDEQVVSRWAKAELAFDDELGVRTMFVKDQFELPESVDVNRMTDFARYLPSPIKAFNLSLETLVRHGVDLARFSFLDIGSGAGRNLILASKFPFAAIIGVEISSHLHALAEENLRVFKNSESCQARFELHCADVLQFDLPDDNLVMYFFEPFVESVGTNFAQNIMDSLARKKRDIILIFFGQPISYIRTSPEFSLMENFKTPLYENQSYSVSIYRYHL